MNKWMTSLLCGGLAWGAVSFCAGSAVAQRQMEKLGRGVAALNQGEGKAFVSWRMLGTDPENVAFNVYRTTGAGQPVKLNPQPISNVTFFQDSGVDFAQENNYTVKPVVNGQEGEASKPFLSKLAAGSTAKPYFSIPMKTPEGYSPGDCSVGDVDGDGEYEIFVHMTGRRARDNSAGGYTDEPIIQAYKIDGTLLWSINLGKNIREGAHYTQFMVYDFDGDGKAEMICKTADGTKDGTGKVIGDPNADWIAKEGTVLHRDTTGSASRGADGMNTFTLEGRILSGPEYLTVFEGATGRAMATVDYVPGIGPKEDFTKNWGDAYGNRSERYLAAVAYLDGVHPSAVMCRGYYHRATLAAWDWRDGKLSMRWLFDSKNGDPEDNKYGNQGNHNLSVADVDGDGKDEIIYGAACIDDNGKGLYTTGLGHGDALHVSDLDPNRPGLEVFDIHENPRHPYGMEFRDAKTGKMIFGLPGIEGQNSPDVGRGIAIDVDPRFPGAEIWGGGGPMAGTWDVHGKRVSQRTPGAANFAVWWDGDFLREILNGNTVSKWNWETESSANLLRAEGCMSNNGSKSTPALSGDLFGDWREEVMLRTAENNELRIFMSPIPTEHRMYTLLHDSQYREAIAWQNVAYNQPPHPSFFLGDGMKPQPKPNIVTVPVAK